MLFSSTIFLFVFLPVVLTLYFVAGRTDLRNGLLILASLFFYAWGELAYTFILIGCIALNYGFGLWLENTRGRSCQRWVLVGAVALNLALLGYFKYADFFLRTLAGLLGHPGTGELASLDVDPIHLPIGRTDSRA
jgi:alginate O-acetyltransferase complex protein AlgI